MKYSMIYSSGGGTDYNGGTWEIKDSPKTVSFLLLDDPFWESNMPKKIRLRKDNHGEHCLRIEEDGEYIVYPYRSGVPHFFTPLKTKTSAEPKGRVGI